MKSKVFLLGVFFSFFAQASTLSDAFSALISVNNINAYQAQVRAYPVLTSAGTILPRTKPQLISMTPPNSQQGCEGVDSFFGGIAYISGKQFVSLLKGIAANTMGYSFSLAMRTLCPICSTVVSDLQKAEQSATYWAMAQCRRGERVVNAITGQQATDKARVVGAIASANLGQDSDFLSAFSRMDGGVERSLMALKQRLGKLTSPSQKKQYMQLTQYGSETWKLLQGLDAVQRIFMQSLVGTTMRYPYPISHPQRIIVESLAPSLSINDVLNLFIYGVAAKHPDNHTLLLNSCEHPNRAGNLFSKQGINLCSRVIRRPIYSSLWYRRSETKVAGVAIRDYGFFGANYLLLQQLVSNIRARQPMDTAQAIKLPVEIYGKAGVVTVRFTRQAIRAFFSAAPLSLYQAITTLALHPTAEAMLLRSVAELIAMNHAIQYIDAHLLRLSLADNSNRRGIGIVPQAWQQINTRVEAMRHQLFLRRDERIKQLWLSTLWQHQLRQLMAPFYHDLLRAYNAN